MALSGTPPNERRCTYLGFPHLAPAISITQEACRLFRSGCFLDTGYRYQRYFSFETDITSFTVDYDFGAGGSASPEFIYLGRADLIAGFDEVEIYSSPDNIVYTLETQFAAPFTLTGPDEFDFFECFDALPAERYWRIILRTTAPTQFAFSKLLFGPLFDFECEPSKEMTQSVNSSPEGRFYTTARKVAPARGNPPVKAFELLYRGISRDVLEAFNDNVLIHGKRFVTLIDTDDRGLFDNATVYHGEISGIDVRAIAEDWYELQFVFKEMRG